jgi:hypothetical protein
MSVLSIPNVVILETVDIDIQTIGVHVHVGDKVYNLPALSLLP